jgi:cytochrome c oxidase subunit IV
MNTHVSSLKTYFIVYALLLTGLAATVGAAYVNLGPLNVVVMLAIAFAKAALVALYFMHVRELPPLNWIAIAAGLVWLVILFGLTLSDFETRSWIAIREPVHVEKTTGGEFRPNREASSPEASPPHAEAAR